MPPTRLLLAALPLLAACPTTEDGPKLDDRTFLSQSVTENGSPRPLVAVEHLVLRFHESPRVGASAGCNTLDGTYSIDDGVFVLSNAAQTEIGCDPDRHAQDDWYFGFLQSRPAITVDTNTLTLEGSAIRIEYLDQELATPDLELVGPTWTVDTIIDGESAMHAAWPTPATLVFMGDGTVQVSTGCNGGSGTYVVEGDRISFSDVAVTERGCSDQLIQQLESAVLGIVHGPQPVTWEIDVARLSLRNESGGIDLVGTQG